MSEAPSTAQGPMSRRNDRILGFATLLVFIAVAAVSSLEFALASAVVFGVFSTIVQVKWYSFSNPKVLAALIAIIVAHLIVILVVRIPEPRFGLVSLPIALIDGFAIYGLLNWIERRFPNKGEGKAK